MDIIKSNGAPKEAGDKRPGDLYRYALWKPLDGLGETPVQLSGDYSLRLRYERNLYADEPGSPKKLEVFELTRNGVIISLHGQGSSIRIDGQDVTDDAEVVKLVALFEEKWDECALLLKTTQVEKQRDGIRTKLERFYG